MNVTPIQTKAVTKVKVITKNTKVKVMYHHPPKCPCGCGGGKKDYFEKTC